MCFLLASKRKESQGTEKKSSSPIPAWDRFAPHTHTDLCIAVYAKQPNHVAGVSLKELHNIFLSHALIRAAGMDQFSI